MLFGKLKRLRGIIYLTMVEQTLLTLKGFLDWLVSLGGIILVNLALLIVCYMACLTQLLKMKERMFTL